MKYLLTGCIVLFVLPWSFSQQVLRVFSAEDNHPIYGVKMYRCWDTLLIATSNSEGYFNLSNVILSENIAFKIQLSHPEYELFEDSIEQKKNRAFYMYRFTQKLDEFIVTAQVGKVKAEDAVQKTTVLTRENLDAKGAINLRDALQNELGIRLSQDPILGSGLKLKGIGSEGVKILIDGVPVIGRNDGSIDLSQINLTNIERIEIIDGPLSVNYGSNAIGGTINLISKKNRKSGHNFNANSYYESNGHYNVSFGFGWTKAKHSVSLQASRNYFDGWTDGKPDFEQPKSKLADSNRFQTWKPKEQYMFGVKYSFFLKSVQLLPYIDLFSEKILNRGLPRPPYGIVAFDDLYTTKRANAGLDVKARLSEKFEMKNQLAYNYFERTKNTFVKDLTTLDQVLSSNNGDQDTSEFSLFFWRSTFTNNAPKSRHNYEFGLEYNHERASGLRIENQTKDITDAAVFTVLNWAPTQRLKVNPGVRVNQNSVYGLVAVPSVHLKYQIRKHTIRLSYAKGFRTPSIKELYLEFVDINHNILGNSNLNPETSHHFQSWYSWKDTIKTVQLSFEINPYYQIVRQKIALAQASSGTMFTYFNIDQFQSQGIQSSVQFQKNNWQAKVGFHYLGIASNYTNNRFFYTPEITSNLQYKWEKTGLSIALFYKYTGKVSSFISNESEEIEAFFLDDYHMLDAQLQYPFWKQKMRLTIGSKNLFNVKNIVGSASSGAHSGGSSTPIGTGRSYYLSLIFNINVK